jgi:stage V sporulation protein B
MTLCVLVLLRLLEKPPRSSPIPVAGPLCRTALPLAGADNLRTGISTVENLMVPKRLALNRTVADPLASFGCLSGMVFPVLMFPACILFGLAELLIPELARCHAAGSRNRISYLMKRSLKVALLYGVLFGGLLFLLAEPLCQKLYSNIQAGQLLKLYALLIPMLYCDAITDAMIKGLGQQTASVRYNILTNLMDVVFLYLLLPKFGMNGYFFSFLVTHAVNFSLSIRRLMKITGERIPLHIPVLTLTAAAGCAYICTFTSPGLQVFTFPALLLPLLYLLGVVRREDIRWLRNLR